MASTAAAIRGSSFLNGIDGTVILAMEHGQHLFGRQPVQIRGGRIYLLREKMPKIERTVHRAIVACVAGAA